MRSKKLAQRSELSIVIIEDDPLALSYEKIFLNLLENYNGFHLWVWGTVRVNDGIEKCAHDAHLADVVILELAFLDVNKRNIVHEIRKLRPDVIIVGITSHTEKHPQSTAESLQLYDIINKHKLNCELPDVIERIYRGKAPLRHRTLASDEGAGPPPTHSSEEIRSQLPRSHGNPYCKGTIQRHNKPLNQYGPSGKIENPTVPLQQRQDRTSIPRTRNYSQRSGIPLQNGNKREHGEKFSEPKPACHDLAAAQDDKHAVDLANLPTVSLTPTELQVIEFSTRGMKPIEIARRLGISANTIYSHRSHIKVKCKTHSWHKVLTLYGNQKKNGTL